MRNLLVVFVLLGAGFVGLGFYRGWFGFASDSGAAKSSVTLTVDTGKMKEDRKAAGELGHAAKDKVASPAAKSMDGMVVSVNSDKLTMTSKDGKEHRHPLAADVKVTCDGKVCKASDLKPGMRIRVTAKDEEPHSATRIEALDENRDFEKVG